MDTTDLPVRMQQKIRTQDLGHDTPCWVWHGATRENGYGVIAKPRGAGQQGLMGSHRYAYELLVGPIPAGHQIDHLCRIRACANPSHMEAVTAAENLRRAFGRQSVDHCKNGHDLRVTGKPQRGGKARRCRVCLAAWQAAYDARRRAA